MQVKIAGGQIDVFVGIVVQFHQRFFKTGGASVLVAVGVGLQNQKGVSVAFWLLRYRKMQRKKEKQKQKDECLFLHGVLAGAILAIFRYVGYFLCAVIIIIGKF